MKLDKIRDKRGRAMTEARRCPVSGKTRYASEAEAVGSDNAVIGVYFCPTCEDWQRTRARRWRQPVRQSEAALRGLFSLRPEPGLEPGTSSLRVTRSTRLSYSRRHPGSWPMRRLVAG